MELHDKIMLPDLGKEAVLRSVKDAEYSALDNTIAEKNTSLDFYYNRNLDEHIQQYFSTESLSQIPPVLMSLVKRFAKSRLMLLKQPAERFINGEFNDYYTEKTHNLDTRVREFGELAWLLGSCHLQSMYNPKTQRIEYKIHPIVKEYVYDGEVYGVSYEIHRDFNGDRQFAFWSKPLDGEQGMHFRFNVNGKMIPVGNNLEMINPYNLIPLSKVEFNTSASDVTRCAVHASNAWTEVMIATRLMMGSPVITGLDTEIPPYLKFGVDRLIALPEGASMQYVSPSANLGQMIQSVKDLINQVGQNHSLTIRWGESSAPPSGEALKILSVDNIETRESDIPVFRDFEHDRYEIDRELLSVHEGTNLSEKYSVDYPEVGFPMTWTEERNKLEFMMEHNLITREELVRKFNPDIDEAELALKMEELEPEQPEQPTNPLLEALQRG
tara:strand:- start:2673 stop:3995 length:1323 start_codon:yes stop_codon:yes gene_type:complete